MRFASISLLLSVLVESTVQASSPADKLRPIVVQLRVDTEMAKMVCSVGILVKPNLILTAAHVVHGARIVRVMTYPFGDKEFVYNVPDQAIVGEQATPSRWDLGYIKLGTAWYGWSDDQQPSMTPVARDDSVAGAALAAFALQRDQQCRTPNAPVGGEFHSVALTLNDREYPVAPGATRMRVFPPLDSGYSGSPVVMQPCGRRDWCVVGIDSEMSNVGGAQSTLVVGFDDPEVRTFLKEELALSLDTFVDANAASDGFWSSVGLSNSVYGSGPLRGNATGPDLSLGGAWSPNRLNSWAWGLGVDLGLEWWTLGGLHSSVASPDGSTAVALPRQPANRTTRFDLIAIGELRRTKRLIPRFRVGWGWAATSVASDGSSVSSSGPSVGVGARVQLYSHLGIDLLLIGRLWDYGYDRPKYTTVPGILTTEHLSTWSPVLGTLATVTYW